MSSLVTPVPDRRTLEGTGRVPWAGRLSSRLVRKFAATRCAYERARLAKGERELDRLVRENVDYTFRYYARFAQLSIASRRSRLQRAFDVDGLPLLLDALAAGNGAILLTAHLGDFDLAGSWLAQIARIPVTTVVDTVSPRLRQSFFDHCRSRGGIALRHEADTRLRDLEDDLKRGRLLVLMADRRVQGPAIEVPFFGAPALFSSVPYLLSLRTGAPILTGAAIATSAGPTVGRITSVRGADLDAPGPREAMAGVAREIEGLIRACPGQWHIPTDLDQLVWRGSLEPDPPSASRHPGC